MSSQGWYGNIPLKRAGLDLVGECPACHASWKGEAIPLAMRDRCHPEETHYSRAIRLYARITGQPDKIRCPECREIFPEKEPDCA